MDNLANAVEMFLNTDIGFHGKEFDNLCKAFNVKKSDLEDALEEINSTAFIYDRDDKDNML